jgi:hypothetical protein
MDIGTKRVSTRLLTIEAWRTRKSLKWSFLNGKKTHIDDKKIVRSHNLRVLIHHLVDAARSNPLIRVHVGL